MRHPSLQKEKKKKKRETKFKYSAERLESNIVSFAVHHKSNLKFHLP